MGGGVLEGLLNLVTAFKNLTFPSKCPACGSYTSDNELFCFKCQKQIVLLDQKHQSFFQNQPSFPDFSSGFFPKSSQAFDKNRFLAWHQGPLAQALHSFKYKNNWASGMVLARFISQNAPVKWLGKADIITCVPLHRFRLIKRGYNQALVLNSLLTKKLPGVLVPDLLKRKRNTRPQVGLNARERKKNVAQAFCLNPKKINTVKNKKILLLDDVLTTGSTAHECALELKKAGASKVMLFTFLSANKAKDRDLDQI